MATAAPEAQGYVWVNGEEIAAMAARLGMTVPAFEEQYVRKVGARKSLVEYENGDCGVSQGS